LTKLEDKIADVLRRREMVDRYAPIVEAAGYLDGTVELTPEDCYFLATKIQKDAEVARRVRTPEFERVLWGCVVDPDYIGAIKSLGDAGRTELRARVNYTPLPILRGGPTR
jgi:hypothetical protein